MAKKVGSVKASFKMKSKTVRFEMDVHLSAEMLFYFSVAKLPEALRKFHDTKLHYKDRMEFATWDEVKSAIEDLAQGFEDAIVEDAREKIIVYRMKLQGDLTPDLAGSDEGAKRFSDLDLPLRTIGMALDWEIQWKVRAGGKTTYHDYLNDRGKERVSHEVYNDDSYNEMTWTPEREKWFEQVEGALAAMVLKADQFFNQKPEMLVAVIQSNQLVPFKKE